MKLIFHKYIQSYSGSIFKAAGGTLLFWASLLTPALAVAAFPGEELPEDFEIYNVFHNTTFYDGYKTDKIVDADLNDGIIRFSNDRYATRLDHNRFADLGADLKLEVLIGALCDNYDRQGRVMLAFTEAGVSYYNPDEVEKIEIARFITPFMNKNKNPKTAPYVYDIDDLRQVLTNTEFLSGKDVWLEVEIFGMPYSARQQIKGCEDHDDVFSATISFGGNTGAPSIPVAPATVTPITISKSEIHGSVNFNNYNPVATDTLGVTTRTFNFTLTEDMADAVICLINTNHGADEEGEEYYRRQHFVYVDKELQLVYTPGGVSCEPYRYLNTQGNMIYDKSRPEEFWEEYSNWCPGQAVPVRRIHLGAMPKGEHSLMIRVPDAVFYGAKGDFRPSAYIIAGRQGEIVDPAGVYAVATESSSIQFKATRDSITIESEKPIREVRIYTYDGVLLEGLYNPGNHIATSHLPSGQFIITATAIDGHAAYLKYIHN